MTKLLGKKLIQGSCDPKGQWVKGKQLPGQSFIQHPEPGFYRVYHNLNKQFNIGLSVKEGVGKLGNITKDSFEVTVTRNNEPIDTYIYMSLSEVDG